MGLVERHERRATRGLGTRHERLAARRPAWTRILRGLAVDGAVLRIHVRDSGDGRPEVQAADADACDGRGLFLVKELADDFGVTEHIVGKSGARPCREPGVPRLLAHAMQNRT
ncbi:ATP-binding protein [Streptomyces sp. NPDC001970]